MQIIAETARLIIREFLPEEEPVFLAHYTDEEVLRYIPKRAREERIAIFHRSIAAYGDKTQLRIWGIFNKTDGDFIGTCLLRPFLYDATKGELGYSIERKYWNQGIGTEMAIAMVNYALSHMDQPTVAAIIVAENIASQRVLEKAGFKPLELKVEGAENLIFFEYQQ